MFKAIREWFANRNKMPAALMTELQSERILLMREQARAKLTYRDATVYGNMTIDVLFADKRIRKMQFSVEDGPRILISLDASLFQPIWSGTLE